jgi:hypothetical protein
MRTNMNNPLRKRNKLEIQVHRGVKEVGDRWVTESREKRKGDSECVRVCPSPYMEVCG